MSKGTAHRPVTWRNLPHVCGLIIAACAVALLACDARPTGREDILAIARAKPADKGAAGHVAADKAGDAAPKVDAGPDPRLAAGSGSTETEPTADNRQDAATPEADEPLPTVPAEPTGATDNPAIGGAQDIPRTPVLFWVDVMNSRVWRANVDGTEKKLLASSLSIASPDGVTVDLTAGYVYWTNMGSVYGGANLGTIQRMRIETERIETILPVGTTNTPKQINIDNKARKLYWCDREGARVWRADLNGGAPEVLVSGHGLAQPVGLALDVEKRQFYFSDRVSRKIYRAGFDAPEGQSPETRGDVETLFSFATGAVPLDLDLDLEQRKLYWTDRSRGQIARANMDPPANFNPENRTDIETVVAGRTEPIGLALDRSDHKLYFTELGGGVYRMSRDGGVPELVSTTGSASGITLAHLPK
jgi:sugar lactone lactonase YvrE